ncbi:DUF6934 family protein [Mucilaginibacter gotjawali]|uniref:Uncharacterized protein n=2 Tax=Mucilaginibacter gotjawali TaxID=1550579 RepID=A0A839SNZ9_9SPHI|nr:hypothetical protein [Mucilaginibacter gotjawali]MBB3059103.1 hypothetical protein [Mucilaginibacter gotjawali]BAU52825.1 hypothetical protein MgSA37_00989 [Mucilaginibacter gotjawali]
MNLERYPYFASNDFKDYEFYSDGPKGRIRKVIMYTKIQDNPAMYNLSFGDADVETGIVYDDVISNNQDRDTVLATVANTINEFCDHYGNHWIFATGSTQSRTRLYQMGIARLWREINIDFDVYGEKNGKWQPFHMGVNYDAFLVKRR